MSTTHRQKAARTIAKRTGLSYQQALNCLLESIAEVEAGLPEVQRRAQFKTSDAPLENPTDGRSLPGGKDSGLFDFPTGKNRDTVSGFRIGTTFASESPVFFDPFGALRQGFPPVTTVVGETGSGKSFLPSLLAEKFTADGVHTIVIDVRGDWAPNSNTVERVDLRKVSNGGLNPFANGGTVGGAALSALNVLRLLIGDTLSENLEEALIRIVEKVAASPSPSLDQVVGMLLKSGIDEQKRVGNLLTAMRDLPFAGLLFGEGKVLHVPDEGVVCFSALGLDLPNPGSSIMSYDNRIGLAVLYSVTGLAAKIAAGERFAGERNALIIRDADVLLGCVSGAGLIKQVARSARSLNTVMVLEGGDSSVFADAGLNPFMFTRFVFRQRTDANVKAVLDLYDESDEHVRKYAVLVRGLGVGEMVMHSVNANPVAVRLDILS